MTYSPVHICPSGGIYRGDFRSFEHTYTVHKAPGAPGPHELLQLSELNVHKTKE